jgi:hypothetical protein
LVDIWWEDVSGDKGLSRERIVLMRPLTLTQNFVDIWWEDVSGDEGVSRERIVSMRPLTLTL